MVIVNTTFFLDPPIEKAAIEWIKSAYSPSAFKCGAVASPMLTRVISPARTDSGEDAYALHIQFPSMEEAKKWVEGVGGRLLSLMSSRWSEKALAMTTYLETLE